MPHAALRLALRAQQILPPVNPGAKQGADMRCQCCHMLSLGKQSTVLGPKSLASEAISERNLGAGCPLLCTTVRSGTAWGEAPLCATVHGTVWGTGAVL